VTTRAESGSTLDTIRLSTPEVHDGGEQRRAIRWQWLASSAAAARQRQIHPSLDAGAPTRRPRCRRGKDTAFQAVVFGSAPSAKRIPSSSAAATFVLVEASPVSLVERARYRAGVPGEMSTAARRVIVPDVPRIAAAVAVSEMRERRAKWRLRWAERSPNACCSMSRTTMRLCSHLCCKYAWRCVLGPATDRERA
jgi:hypothetical protein